MREGKKLAGCNTVLGGIVDFYGGVYKFRSFKGNI